MPLHTQLPLVGKTIPVILATASALDLCPAPAADFLADCGLNRVKRCMVRCVLAVRMRIEWNL